MSVFEYFVLSLALGIELMTIMRTCAEKAPIRLTRGLAVSFLAAIVYALFLYLGIQIGNLLRFEGDDGLYDNINSMVYLGMMIVIGVKMLLPVYRKGQQRPAYDISRWGTVLALIVASGINVLLIGIGLGFLVSASDEGLKGPICLAIVVFLISYWAIMLGRQKKAIREHRWLLIAVLLLLVSAIFRVVEL